MPKKKFQTLVWISILLALLNGNVWTIAVTVELHDSIKAQGTGSKENPS
jgi:hypothetical protein